MGVSISSRGAFGGFYLLWKKGHFELVEWNHSNNWLQVNLNRIPYAVPFSIFNVYIPFNYQEKILGRIFLKLQARANNIHLIIVGDFNTDMHPS